MNHRSHNNADKRVYRIVHTQGELKGKVSEIHGREWFQYVSLGRLIVCDAMKRTARVADGWIAIVESKTKIEFVRFLNMVTNWDILEKVYIFSGKAISMEEKDILMRRNQPLIPAEDFRVGESRVRIGPKKDKKFARRIEYASTQPVY
jgi:hypothetical protein